MALAVNTLLTKGPLTGSSHWSPPARVSGNWGEMGRTRVCPKTEQDRRFPLLGNLAVCVPETCRTKTYTWLFWQEQEGLDYPFPPRESGHLRRACRRSICFNTNRTSVRPPHGLHGRHGSSDGRAAAVHALGVKGSVSPCHLSVPKRTVATEGALTSSAPFSSHQRL